MQVKPNFIIICREAFLQAGNNNLNLIGIFTTIHADRFPFPFPQFAVVVNFDIDTAGDYKVHTEVLNPKGERITETQLPVRTTAGNWQVIANFEQMQFASAGIYTFRLSLDGVPLGERTLRVLPARIAVAGRPPSVA